MKASTTEVHRQSVEADTRLDSSLCWLPNAQGPRSTTFDDYYVCKEHLSFSVQTVPYHIVATEAGQFIQLGCVLSSLYRLNDVRRPLFKVLEELAGCLPLKANRLYRRINGGSTMLAEGLEQSGFEVIGLTSYGRSVNVQVGWVLAGDRGSPKRQHSFYALSIDFHPQPDRSLNNGRWLLPVETTLGFVLGQILIARTGSQPLNALSSAGQQAALETFKWTKVSLLNASELRQARIAFINGHPELAKQPKEMAKAMKADGLYTDITDICAITKQLSRLMMEAGVRVAE